MEQNKNKIELKSESGVVLMEGISPSDGNALSNDGSKAFGFFNRFPILSIK